MEVREILEKVKAGTVSVEEAEQFFKKKPFEELGYAKLDTHREIRSGFPEVVYCSSKPDEYLVSIYKTLLEKNGEVFGTRADRRQYELVKKVLPQVTYDEVSHILKIEKPDKKRYGRIAVCTAGTADIPVAEEAAQTAEYFGSLVERVYDVGVSGIHRLLARLDVIQQANCVVAVAGMEGALASVIGGLVSRPVIAVPTSVGYGASMKGLSALLTMINSCANGIAVVNIDNGYGAGYIATQINKLGGGQEGSAGSIQTVSHGVAYVSSIEEGNAVSAEKSGEVSIAENIGAISPSKESDALEAEEKGTAFREPGTFIYRLETNIDDCSGEALGYTMDRLMEAGARDVHFVPVYMKKNRPAYELVVICDEDKIDDLQQIIFEETTTIGIRRVQMERTMLKRSADTVMLEIGELKVKRCTLPNGEERRYPEFDSVKELAAKNGMSFQQVLNCFNAALDR